MQLLHTIRLTLHPASTRLTLPPAVAKHPTSPSPTANTPIRISTHEEPPHGRPRRGDVDDAIPETHEGEDDAGGVGEGEGNEVRVDKRVDSVDRGGDLGRFSSQFIRPMLMIQGMVRI